MKKVTVETFERAFKFCIDAHHGQKRKGDGRPYFLHPVDVVLILLDLKMNEKAYVLGSSMLLHDTVEDCPEISIEMIAKEFGYQIASIVDELTNDPEEIERIGKTQYLCQKVLILSSYALTGKLGDRLSNVRSMGGLPEIKRKNYIEQTKQIIQTLEEKRKLSGRQKKLIKMIKSEIKKHK